MHQVSMRTGTCRQRLLLRGRYLQAFVYSSFRAPREHVIYARATQVCAAASIAGKAAAQGRQTPEKGVPLVVLKAPRSGSLLLCMLRQRSGGALLPKRPNLRLAG